LSLADSPDPDELEIGDVIVIDRSVGEIQSRTFATVVAIGVRGPKIVGPSCPVSTYANALKIDWKTKYDRISAATIRERTTYSDVITTATGPTFSMSSRRPAPILSTGRRSLTTNRA
jgi:hypothetical protein